MIARWGLGPVFAVEWRASSRRWQGYALRSLFVAALLVGLAIVWWSQAWNRDLTSLDALAGVGLAFFYTLTGVQLALVLLAAPAATAGAICQDKARGTLAHMLVTDLSDAEIVLGKLVARLVPVVGLIACALPVAALTTLLGGVDPWALTLAFAVTLAVAVLGCAMALAFSVWAGKTHEVLMATYALWTLALLAAPLWISTSRILAVGGPPWWVWMLNPFWVAFAPDLDPGRLGVSEYAWFFGVTLGLAAVLVIVSILRMRSVVIGQLGRPSQARRTLGPRLSVWGQLIRRLPAPSLDGNPVLWREWHRNRPSRWSRVIWTGFALGITICSLWGIADLIRFGLTLGPSMGGFTLILQVPIGLLLLSASASTSLTEERARGSLDVLLATPIATASIVWGKWWGTYRVVPLLAVWPGLLALAMAVSKPQPPPGWIAAGMNWEPMPLGYRLVAVALIGATVLAHGALLTSLGLALATWIPRQGRAAALCVGAFVMITAGWPAIVIPIGQALFPLNHQTVQGLTILSPFFGTAFLCEAMTIPWWSWRWSALMWGIFWMVLVSLAAVCLYIATLLTFDDRLGRVSDHSDLDLIDLLTERWDDPEPDILDAPRPAEVGVPVSNIASSLPNDRT